MTSVEILGCRVDAVGRDEGIERIVAFANGKTPSLVVTLGVEMAMYARRDARFRAVVARAALSLCDTIGVLLASRLRGGPLRERVTGVDLIEPLAKRSAQTGDIRLFLFGGKPGVAQLAATRLAERYPGVKIAGARSGYFADAESNAIAAQIRSSHANLLLVGLGSPKQEFWLDTNLASTGCGCGIGIGGSLDIVAGTVQRAPQLWQRLGLEWLYRLVREPARWRRQLALPRFAAAILGETIAQRFGRTQQR